MHARFWRRLAYATTHRSKMMAVITQALLLSLSISSAAWAGARASGVVFATTTAADSDPWTRIEGNMRWAIGDLHGRTPSGTPTPWRDHREALGMSTRTLAFTGRSFEDAHVLIDALAEEDLLAWERGLFATTYDADRLPERLAQAWIEFLRAWPVLDEGARIQRHLGLRLRMADAALASLAPTCLPSTLSNAQLLEDLASIETDLPGRRLRSRIEPPPQRPEQLTDAVFRSPDAPSVHAAVSLVALTSPATPILADWTDNTSPAGDHCAQHTVQRFFRLMLDPRIDGHHEFDMLVQESPTFPVSKRWCWRFAMHRYLMGDGSTVRSISAYFQESYPDDVEGSSVMKLLADITKQRTGGDDATAIRNDWPRAGAGSNPTYQWVSAEAARVRQKNAAAERALTQITDRDVHFVAAWISLAAARGALGRGRGVHLARQTLEDVAPPLPIYDYWRATLKARTDR